MNTFFSGVIFLYLYGASTVYSNDGWETFSKLKLDQRYDTSLGEMLEMPVFSDELRALDGEVVTLEGYVIPLQSSGAQDYFVLSRFPYSNCFFCGNAGPETVAEVYTNEPFPYRDAKVRVTGQLKLNADDPLHLFFIFTEAEVAVLD